MTENASHDELRRSNLLRLECQELIKENIIESDAKVILKARQFLQVVETAVNSLRETSLEPSEEHEKLIGSVGYKFQSDKYEKKDLSVEKFNGSELAVKPIDAFGASLAAADTSGASIGLLRRSGGLLQCDVCVVMPHAWFQEKDYLNFRYFDKRNLIVSHIVRQLSQKKHRKALTASIAVQCSDGHKLCIIAKPVTTKKIKSSSNFELRLILGTDGFVFPETRYLPDRHNCRFNTNTYSVKDNEFTPHYNAALAEDACYLYMTNLIKDECASSRAYAEASVLFKIWQIQHTITDEINVLHLILLLSQKRLISRNMTPLQIFILMLKYITDHFFLQGNLLDAEEACKDNKILPYIDYYSYDNSNNKQVEYFSNPCEEYQNIEIIQLFESKQIVPLFQRAYTMTISTSYNVLFRVKKGQVQQAYYSAKSTLKAMSFREMFLTKYDFYDQYDLYIQVNTSDINGNVVEYGNDAAARKVQEVMSEALFGRAKLAVVQNEGSNDLRIGVKLLNSSYIGQRVTRGPSGSSKHIENARKFKKFWGEKTELRRFGDGSVVYACVWKDGDAFDIVTDICTYILGYHLKLKPYFPLDGLRHLVSSDDKDCCELTKKASDAFECLSKFLHDHDLNLPLEIAAIECCASSLRYSDLYPPEYHPILDTQKKFSESTKIAGCVTYHIPVNIKLNNSGKWPREPDALQAAKLAFLLRIADNLPTEQFKQMNVYPTYLEFGFKGYSFRCYLNIDMSESLKYHTIIHACHTRYSSSSATLRLLKRWSAAHLLSGVVEPEVLECIVCKAYSEYEVNSVVTGFIRCLKLMSSYDFSRNPFVVDPHGHFSDEDLFIIHKQFETFQEQTKSNHMYIVTPSSENFKPSIMSPEPVILSRIMKLAALSLHNLMSYYRSNAQDDSWEKIFRTSTGSFSSFSLLLRVNTDFIFNTTCSSTDHLCSQDSFRKGQKMAIKGPLALRKRLYKNIGYVEVMHGWNPITEIVAELRARFGHLALFFYNEYTPEVICILWRPSAFKAESFSAKNSEYKRPLVSDGWAKDSLVTTNYEEVLSDIKHACKDIITGIKVQDESYVQPAVERSENKRMKASTVSESDEESSNDEESSSSESI